MMTTLIFALTALVAALFGHFVTKLYFERKLRGPKVPQYANPVKVDDWIKHAGNWPSVYFGRQSGDGAIVCALVCYHNSNRVASGEIVGKDAQDAMQKATRAIEDTISKDWRAGLPIAPTVLAIKASRTVR